jgi:hypothetical protein
MTRPRASHNQRDGAIGGVEGQQQADVAAASFARTVGLRPEVAQDAQDESAQQDQARDGEACNASLP